jgi:peptidoglycan/LPS O-acetylase OafA/YrhL
MNENGVADYVRFVGAIAIVYFHLKLPYNQYGLAALSIFASLAVFFLATRKEYETFASEVVKRVHRLLTPWLFWSAIYGLFKVLDALASHRSPQIEFEWWMLLTGSAIHLWFLPFIFIIDVLVIAIKRPLISIGFGFPVAAGGYLLFCIFVSYLVERNNLGIPFRQWITVLPACAFGLVLALTEESTLRVPKLLSLSLLVYVVQVGLGWNFISIQLLVSSLVCTLALAAPYPRSALSRQLAGWSLGIYLIHPLAAAFLWRIPALVSLEWVTFFATVTASLLATVLLSKIPLFRKYI